MNLMYGRRSLFQVQYDTSYTLDNLHEGIDLFMEKAGYELAIKTLNAHLTGAGCSLYHDEELRGIDLRVRKILEMTK
jgi:hypothetical protein